ncbi:hypothetical protein [Caballeronia glebae]|uniref:hypothetical protein n=1 Tax=Caballeronia glebae TaxID=1777143 RepID=UPI0038BCA5F2
MALNPSRGLRRLASPLGDVHLARRLQLAAFGGIRLLDAFGAVGSIGAFRLLGAFGALRLRAPFTLRIVAFHTRLRSRLRRIARFQLTLIRRRPRDLLRFRRPLSRLHRITRFQLTLIR